MIADIIIISIILLFGVIGVARGIAKTILNIAAFVLSILVANWLSEFLSELIYTSFVKEAFTTNLQTAMQTTTETTLQNSMSNLPEWAGAIVNPVLSFFGINADSAVKTVDITTQLATTAESLLKPFVVGVFAMILTALLALVLFIIAKMFLVKPLAKVFRIPVLRQLNQLFGGILGLLEGLLIAFIAANLYCLGGGGADAVVLANPDLYGQIFRFLT